MKLAKTKERKDMTDSEIFKAVETLLMEKKIDEKHKTSKINS